MPDVTVILIFLGLGILVFGVMALWHIQRTMTQGFNEIIRGLEEIAVRLSERPDDLTHTRGPDDRRP